MGVLDDGHIDVDVENGLRSGSSEFGLGDDLETAVIEDAVKVMLEGLGEDPGREGLRRTPIRVAKALKEETRGYQQKAKDIVQDALFPELGMDGRLGAGGGLVVVRDIDLFSCCESCLLPFKVKFHAGYIPSGQRVLGLSKLSRVADVFAKRLQDPQRLANEVCTALQDSMKPAGVAVVLQCWHIQFPGVYEGEHESKQTSIVDKHGSSLVSVYSCSGVFENENNEAWGDFSSILKLRGVRMEKNLTACKHWCPSKSQDSLSCNGLCHRSLSKTGVGLCQPAMVAAANSIISSLGDDPLREELIDTPQRFVQWLMNFKRPSLEVKLNGFSRGKMGPSYFSSKCEKTSENGSCRIPNVTLSELNLPFLSLCEHHLLPFHGVVHIGFYETEAISRSTLQSIVHFYSCMLQMQERLTRQISETVASMFGGGVMVVVEAKHICMISRGIGKVASSTATMAALGRFSTDPVAKEKFLNAISDNQVQG